MKLRIDAETFVGGFDGFGEPYPEAGLPPEILIPVVVNGRPAHAYLKVELEDYSYRGNAHSGVDGSATYKILDISI